MTDDMSTNSQNKQGILTGECLSDDEQEPILSLRPEKLSDYIGQVEVVEALNRLIISFSMDLQD